jgi:SAM-dependent methyltransferase
LNTHSSDGAATAAFDKLSTAYDSLWFFSEKYQTWMENNIREALILQSDSVFADIGGGTGVVTARLALNARISRATCVEPSAEMLRQATKYPNLVLENSTAEMFAESKNGFNRILIKETIHHIKDRKYFWINLKKNNPNSRVLVVTRPCKPGFLLFEKAYKEFEKNQPSSTTLVEEIEGSGYKVTLSQKAWPVEMPKQKWYQMLESRFISDLFKLTDEEIRQGIQEIEKTHKDSNSITFNDNIIFISLN